MNKKDFSPQFMNLKTQLWSMLKIQTYLIVTLKLMNL